MQDPQPEFQPIVGKAEQITDGLRRILAPNPSPMTYKGTNTYLLGEKDVAVIDPGPEDDAHLNAIIAATSGRISHIIVTHAHLDHSPLARQLSAQTGAKIYGFGAANAGRSSFMKNLSLSGLAGGGEGIDAAFSPDITLQDGSVIEAAEWTIEAVHTPGHLSNHLCFAWENSLFSGDHVMGWASSLVSPPDGDLGAFMQSCARLQRRKWQRFYPGHGAPVETANSRLDDLIAHRKMRESQVIEHLQSGPADAAELAQRIYHDVNPALLTAAARNVFAHLLDLYQRNITASSGALSAQSRFHLTDKL